MIKKIVLTGGPCAGKSTSISKIERKFSEEGFIVLVVPETATELINMGIKPFGENKIDMYEFQKYIFSYQLAKEKLIDDYIKSNKDKDIIVLYDRSILDNKSYVSDAEFNRLLSEFNMTESDIINRYDMAIHLLTAAKGTDVYTLENNKARSETKEEAIVQDDKTLKCYLGFPHHIIVDNSTSFDEKIDRVIFQIDKAVKGKVSRVKQRKFLVDKIDNEYLENYARRLLVTQTYLNNDKKDVMVRKVDYENSSSYYLSIKSKTNNPSEKIVTERIISEREYNDLVSERNDILTKDRYCFEKDNVLYRVDVFNDGLVLLEVEGYIEVDKLPEEIEIIKEVTNDENYTNKNIARMINSRKYVFDLSSGKI